MEFSNLFLLYRSFKRTTVVYTFFAILVCLGSCTLDYPAVNVTPNPPKTGTPKPDTSICSCTTSPGSSTTSPVSSTTATTGNPLPDTLSIPAPRFSPNGGLFYGSTAVQLTADSLPPQAVIEYSTDDGKNWQTGQQFTLSNGGKILSRLRVGEKVSGNRSANFNFYYKRMLVIGNSIMNHGPAPELGWYNFNGMAASAPEKDFVHLLTAQLAQLYPQVTVRQQSGGGFEREFGKSTYSLDEFNEAIQGFKPDLIVVRIGENIEDSQVQTRNLEAQFRLLLDRLVSAGQPLKIVCTTSVWYRPQADAVIRKVTTEKGYQLVDLSCMVGQGQYFASQYADIGVAAHPNDTGMQRIADLIWAKVR